MRGIPINCTTIYRWLYTTTAPNGTVGQSAVGPYSRKQSVNHYVARGHKAKAELQELIAAMGDDNELSKPHLKWVTVKTVELENP